MNYHKVALVACSNGLQSDEHRSVDALIEYLNDIGTETVCSPYIYAETVSKDLDTKRNTTGENRAKVLMDFFEDDSINAIFDISGGDLGNEILPYLDFKVIKKHPKIFYGYSDLSTVCNAIYTKSGIATGLFQVKTLVWDETGVKKSWFEGWDGKTDIGFEFIQGRTMSGTAVGGNIRCFLKLAGTEYFPDLKGKVLVLESWGGLLPQSITGLAQIAQMPGFKDLKGIILGTFTQLDEAGQRNALEKEVLKIAGDIPVAVTKEIGHDKMCKCIMLGEEISLS